MATIAEALALAVRHHQAGNIAQAEQLYRQVLLADAGNPEALHLLGVLACQVGQYAMAVDFNRQALVRNPTRASTHFNLASAYHGLGRREEAVDCYREAIRLRPDYADACYNLGNLLRELGRLDEAVASYREAVRLRPNFPEGWGNLGATLADQGLSDEAVASYRRALDLRPDFPDAHYNLGNALKEMGRLEEAEECYRQALRLRPDHYGAYTNLGNVFKDQGRLGEAHACYRQALQLQPTFAGAHSNLGNVLRDQRRLSEAEDCYRQAVRLEPNSAEAHFHLAICLADQGRLDEAETSYRMALRLRPDYPDALNNLGNTLRHLDRLDEAVDCYHGALRLRADFAGAHNNLGIAVGELGRFEEAEACYCEALRLRPDYHEARFHLAHLWLQRGDFARGWPEYEWRWHTEGFVRPTFQQPHWDGSDLAGRTILLQAEQGLGDMIQFIRYAPLVKQRGGRVVVQCPPPLREVFQTCRGIDELVPQGTTLPAFDVYAPLLSLPGLMDTTVDNVPADIPYLAAHPQKVQQWQPELERLGRGVRVGIVWQGSRVYRNDRRRSVTLAQFEPLARLPGVRLVSLQVGAGVEQLATIGERWPICDLGSCFDPSSFADAAAVLSGLDLLVSVDTALVHLAGALGRPVWLALPFAPDWRWLLEREDSPWYPGLRLFRQQRPGQWAEVFERMAAALGELQGMSHGDDCGSAGPRHQAPPDGRPVAG
jgi:tetratricopeptide (TPR) repeat protein